MKVCVYGLGEAGSSFARDLVDAGAEVTAYDPALTDTPRGVKRLPHPALAARKAELIIALTPEVDAKLAILQAIDIIDDDALYADLSTSSPSTKAELQNAANLRRFEFADVALMGMVPGRGIRTPSLASGPGASRYAEAIADLGGSAEVIEGAAGTAAARKLLRSVMMKGMSAVVAESVRAAASADDLAWLWANLTTEITNADEEWLRRLVTGTGDHYERRTDEMISARELLVALGVEPIMTEATIASLQAVPSMEIPALP